MTRDEQRQLLTAFCAWLRDYSQHKPLFSFQVGDQVDAFLATLRSQRPARSIKIPGPAGPISLTPPCDDCALTDDHCPTCEREVERTRRGI